MGIGRAFAAFSGSCILVLGIALAHHAANRRSPAEGSAPLTAGDMTAGLAPLRPAIDMRAAPPLQGPDHGPLVRLSAEQRARIARKLERPEDEAFDDPDLAAAFYVNSRTGAILTRGPNLTTGARTLDPAAYLPAIEQMRKMPRYDSGTSTMLPSRDAADPGAANLLGTWSAIGPSNQGGRTRALLIDPANPAVMYASGVAGGVWKSTDAGANWMPLSDLAANLAVTTLAFDSQSTSILYAGTGEGFFNIDAIRGAGIFRSADAGLSWSQLASTNGADFHYTNKILVSPRNNQRLFAATRAGLFRSIDGGASWTSLAVAANNGCTDLAIQAQGPSGYVFAACGQFAPAAIYRVPDDNTSAPQTVFNPAGMGRASIAVAPSNQAVVYVLGSQQTAGAGPGQDGLHGVYRSTANGDPGTFATQRQGNVAPANTLQKINQLLLSNPVIALLTECGFGTSSFANQGWYDNVIAVDPVNANRVWVGGIDLWRSDNGGVDWGTAGYWWFGKGMDTEYHHADQHGIVFHPQYNGTSNRVLFATSDGGVDRIDNATAPVNTTLAQLCGAPVPGGPAWVDRNNGYATTQFYDGVPYPNGQSYFGGLQDNGTQRGTSGSPSWSVLLGGDGGYTAVDTLGDASSANDVLFGEFTGLSIQRSTNGGTSFADAATGITGDSGFAFIAPFAMNTGFKQQLWTGGWYVWRTTNQATSWTRASAITAGNGSIAAIAAHPLDGNRVLVGMSDGYIHSTTTALSNNSATTWPNARPSANYVSWIAWDPGDLNVAYATVSAFASSTVFKTVNGGATWTATMGTGGTALPQIPALSVAVNPANSQQVFVGTDLGVFVSLDGGASWLLENAGFANVPVESLKFNETAPRRLFAFTHGRGAWSVSTGCPTVTITTPSLAGGTFATAYSQTLTATGGTAPYSFVIETGALPPGLNLSGGGALTGTPTAAGTYNFTVRAGDVNSCAGTQAYTLAIGQAVSTTTVAFEAGPYVYRGTPFIATATAIGPGGLNQTVPVSYSGNCTIVTTTNGCTASATFAATTTHQASSGSASITITRASATTIAANRTVAANAGTVSLGATVTATTAVVNEGTVTFTVRQGPTTIGVPITSGPVTAGAASATFNIPGGTAAGGYTIDAAYNAGANFVAGGTTAGTLTLTGNCPAITLTPGALPAGALLTAYSQAITAIGGAAPHTFAVTGGALPAGLTLSGAGVLGGIPTSPGPFTFTITATATGGCTGTQDYAITVNRAPSTVTVDFEPGPYVYRGTPFTATATATGPGGLSQPLPVSYTGECTIPTVSGGCTATASFPGSGTHLPSASTSSITILQPTDAQPPTDFRVDLVDGAFVRFRWTAPRFGPAPQSYILEGGTSSTVVLAAISTNSASPVFDVVVPTGAWVAWIKSVAAANSTVSARSNEVPVIVNLPVPPSAPVNLTGVVSGSSLGLSWKNTFGGGPPTGVVLDVSGSAVTSIPLGVSESFAFSGVPDGTYTLQLREVNGGGASAASNPIALTFPGACTGIPEAPANFLAYTVGAEITVIWDPPPTGAAPTSYVLSVSGSYVGTFPLTERRISAPVAPGSYTISVASVNACGTGAATASQTIVVP